MNNHSNNTCKVIDKRTLEILTPKHDLYVEKLGKDNFNILIFNAKIKNPDKAFIRNEGGDSQFIQDFFNKYGISQDISQKVHSFVK